MCYYLRTYDDGFPTACVVMDFIYFCPFFMEWLNAHWHTGLP